MLETADQVQHLLRIPLHDIDGALPAKPHSLLVQPVVRCYVVAFKQLDSRPLNISGTASFPFDHNSPQ